MTVAPLTTTSPVLLGGRGVPSSSTIETDRPVRAVPTEDNIKSSSVAMACVIASWPKAVIVQGLSPCPYPFHSLAPNSP